MRKLPLNEILTEKVVKELLVSFTPNTRSRQRAYTSLKALGKWANLELKDWSKLKTNYEPQERYQISSTNY